MAATVSRVSIPIFASSNDSSNVSTDGSTFDYEFSPPLSIPSGAINATIALVQANVWYVSPYNISTSLGNTGWVISTTGTVALTDEVLTFPDGLYDIAGLNTRLEILLQAVGLVGNEIVISGIAATETILLTFTESTESGTITLNTTNASFTMAATLGLSTSADITSTDGYAEGSTAAEINNVSYYIVRCSAAASSYSVTGSQGQGDLAALVPSDASIGAELFFQPVKPIKVDIAGGSGQKFSKITFTLLDDTGAKVNTQKETWSVRVVVTYDYPIEQNKRQRYY